MEFNTADEAIEDSDVEVGEEVVEIAAKLPFYLGYKPNEFSITWQYESMSLSRVGFMHPDYNHLFIQYMIKVSRERGLRILRINTENNPIEFPNTEGFPLLDMELNPTYEGLNELEETRMKWVQLYLRMLCYINNKDRSTFIPQMKYFKGQEGPLAGYLRSIEELRESPDKDLLLNHINNLRVVDWGILNDETGEVTTDYIYTIKGDSFNEKLESFFIGCWCVLNIHYSRDVEQYHQLLTFMQFGEDLLIEGLDTAARYIIEETVKLIADLTLPSLDHLQINQKHALFIQSPLLFPNVYPSISHMLYGVEKTRDFDIKDLIEGMAGLIPNEALYRSKVVLGNGDEFIRKVYLPIEY